MAMCVSSFSSASAASYGGGTGFDFGVIPGYPALDNAAGYEPILDIGINGSNGIDLGCAGIDLFGFIETTFNFNFNVDRFVNNLKTKVAKWALTQMMATPQIAAVFDTLNQMENFRWDMFNENCDIGEIKEDAKAQFIKFCAKKPGESEITCQEKYETQSTGYLKQAADKYAEMLDEIGKMEDVLPFTKFCKVANGERPPNSCGLMAFLPTMRFCHTSSVGDGGLGCADTGVKVGDRPLGFGFFLDAATDAFNRQVYGTSAATIEEMVADKGLDEMKLVARKARAEGPPPAPDIANVSEQGKDYLKFAGCSNWDALAATRQLATIAGGSYTSLPDAATYINQIDATLANSGLQDGLGTLSTTDQEEAKELMRLAVGCVANHDVVISPEVELGLQTKPRAVREEFRSAVALEASLQSTSDIIGFLDLKLGEASAQIGATEEAQNMYTTQPDCEGSVLDLVQVGQYKHDGIDVYQCDMEVDPNKRVRQGFEIFREDLRIRQKKLEEKKEQSKRWESWGDKFKAL